jgi:hypothetical protein
LSRLPLCLTKNGAQRASSHLRIRVRSHVTATTTMTAPSKEPARHDAGASYSMGTWHCFCTCSWHKDEKKRSDARMAVYNHYLDNGMPDLAAAYKNYWTAEDAKNPL